MNFPMGEPVSKRIKTCLLKASFLWLFPMAFFAPAVRGQALDRPLIQTYTTADFGADGGPLVVRQGPDGVLYFGSDLLLTFDGSRWKRFPMNHSYALRGLDFGKDGKLWAGASNEIGFYQQNLSGQWIYDSLTKNLPSDQKNIGHVWHAFADGDGAVFVAAEKVLRWDGKKFQAWSMPTQRHLDGIKTGSEIFIQHAATGLHLMTADGPRLIIPASLLGNTSVRWLEKNSTGYLLVTTHGISRYTGEKLTPFAPEASEYIRTNRLTSAVKLPDGRVALGTQLGGIGLWDPTDGKLTQILGPQDGLPADSVSSLFVDREQNFWVTFDSQICRLTLKPTSTIFSLQEEIRNQPIINVARSEGRIHVATLNSLSWLDSNKGTFQHYDWSPVNVSDLHATPAGLFVGVSNGVKKISEGKATTFMTVRQNAFVVMPSRLRPDNFLVSDGYSIFLVDHNGKSEPLVRNLPDIVSDIAEDNRGRLWLGTSMRATLVATPDKNGPVEAVQAGEAYGLPDTTGTSRVAATNDGKVLIITPSGGWVLGENANHFVPVEKCPGWNANALSNQNADGSFWVAYPSTETRSASVARIAFNGDKATWEPHSVESLWTIGTPTSIFVESDTNATTTLWIGGTNGLLRNLVEHGPITLVPHSPVLHSFARSKETEEPQSITHSLPYSTSSLVFEFAAPEFARRPALHLETMLDGIDQHWKPADASGRRELTALREGHYTFRVRAVAETGIASAATVSEFEILPPWWRTSGALFGAFLVLIPTAYGVYRWRVQLLKQRNVELERKVHERTEQLEKASAAKTQFVANMSHDIRNPLNGIVGLALALEDTWLDVKQRELVSTLRECTTYLSTLVDDVLDFATIEAGKIELRPAPFSPAELLKAITMMFKMEAISSGGVLSVETDPNLPKTYVGDAGRIQQVLVNFVSNALKYSGGPIKLGVSIPEDAPEEIEFSVTDQGPGISEEGQRLLFTKFSRLTDSQSKEITGTGLGLASCRLLAGLMSGSVGVRSRPGHGARFYLRLPLDIFPTPAPEATPKPMAVPILPNCNVLLVEDTNYNAMAAAAVLGKFGLSCERACSGAEALKLFAEKRHNLILLDRNLPDMDGTEVARRIRALEANGPRTIILAVTAYCTLEDRALCLNAGMDAFVGKPLTPQKLRRVLTAAGRRHLAAASMHVSPDVVSPAIDVSLLEYISDGSGQGLNRQIELFLIALGEAEKQLDQAAREVDFRMLAEAAHGVISHARLVGCASLSTAAAGLQTAANAHDHDAFGTLLVRVKREIETLTALVRRHPGAERPA